jgi:hypothetical protein
MKNNGFVQLLKFLATINMQKPYNKSEVILVEQMAVRGLLAQNSDLYAYSPLFIKYITKYYPEWQTEKSDTKIIKVSQMCEDAPIYYWEEVGAFLWNKWNQSRADTDRNNFLTYLFPIIDGVIFRSGQHLKSKMGYSELFQELCLVCMAKVPKYDPKRARTYSYFNNALFWSLITITTKYKKDYPDFENIEDIDKTFDDDNYGLAEIGILLSNLVDDSLDDQDEILYSAIIELLKSDETIVGFLNNPIGVLQKITGMKKIEITDFFDRIRKVIL